MNKTSRSERNSKAFESHLNCHRPKKIGKFTDGKNRTFIVKLGSDYSKRLILLSLRKLKVYEKPVYISREQNPDEQIIEIEYL